MTRGLSLFLCCGWLLSACGHNEVLEPFSARPPAGVDFSGTWDLREDESASQRSILRAIDKTDGVKNTTPAGRDSDLRGRTGRPSRDGRSFGGLAHVFLETGRQLKITQTPDGFFISIDRAVVEEFRFGERRMVSVGEIEAQRSSGWEGEAYVVETLDEKGMKLIERFWLSDDRNTLNREITFRSKKMETATVNQYFGRAGSGG